MDLQDTPVLVEDRHVHLESLDLEVDSLAVDHIAVADHTAVVDRIVEEVVDHIDPEVDHRIVAAEDSHHIDQEEDRHSLAVEVDRQVSTRPSCHMMSRYYRARV